MNIILASASPRRRELLTMLGLSDFKVIPANGDEIFPIGMPPGEAAAEVSLKKAEEVAQKCNTDDIIIAADTIVTLGGEIMGKPADEDNAYSMLSRLSGHTHKVYTGVTVIRGHEIVSGYESTHVRFRELTDREIRAYINTGEPMDKAGAYGAQGIGALFVEGIDGDFFNVMGLPLCRLSKMLKKLGVSLI